MANILNNKTQNTVPQTRVIYLKLFCIAICEVFSGKVLICIDLHIHREISSTLMMFMPKTIEEVAIAHTHLPCLRLPCTKHSSSLGKITGFLEQEGFIEIIWPGSRSSECSLESPLGYYKKKERKGHPRDSNCIVLFTAYASGFSKSCHIFLVGSQCFMLHMRNVRSWRQSLFVLMFLTSNPLYLAPEITTIYSGKPSPTTHTHTHEECSSY